jgi:hypothetical protein
MAWRRANPDKSRAIYQKNNHRSNLKLRFDLTTEQFDVLYEACDGCCGICLKPETRDRRLSLDHDHATKELRGFICNRCNLLLGIAKDDPKILEQAAVYVRTARLSIPPLLVTPAESIEVRQ